MPAQPTPFVAVVPRVIQTVADLRSTLPNLTNSAYELRGYVSTDDGGQGDFFWDAASTEADNGGTIFQVTSPLTATGRWKRIFVGDLDARWFGAKGDATTDDTAAVQAALNALPSAGGGVTFQEGRYRLGNLTCSRPTRFQLGRGNDASRIVLDFDAALLSGTKCVSTNSNVVFRGVSTDQTKVSVPPTYAGVGFTTPYQNVDGATPHVRDGFVEAHDVYWFGGKRAIDTTGAGDSGSGLSNARVEIRRCVFEGFSSYAVVLDSTVSFCAVDHVYFVNCKGSLRNQVNTETLVDFCENSPPIPTTYAAAITMSSGSTTATTAGAATAAIEKGDVLVIAGAGNTGPTGTDLFCAVKDVSGTTLTLDTASTSAVAGASVTVSAPTFWFDTADHARVRNTYFSHRLSLAPDVRIGADNDLGGGAILLDSCKFQAEQEHHFDKRRCRVEVYSLQNKNYGVQGLRMRDCWFYGKGSIFFTSLQRTSNVVTATLNVTYPAFGHGLAVGDRFAIVGSTEASFNGVWTVATVPSITTLTFASTGSDTALIADGSTVAIPGETNAIRIRSPLSQPSIKGNNFFSFGYAVDDDPDYTNNAFGLSGHGEWRGNIARTQHFTSREFRHGGKGFDHIDVRQDSGQIPISSTPMQLEATGYRQNRLPYSQNLQSWLNSGTAGVTALDGQTDFFGGTTATRLTRDGLDVVYNTISLGLGERISTNFTASGLPNRCFLYLDAKKNAGTDNLTITFYDDPSGDIVMNTIDLTTSWKRYRIPIHFKNSFGTYQLHLTPGGEFPAACSCYVARVQLSDFESDYIATLGASVTTPTATEDSVVVTSASYLVGTNQTLRVLVNYAGAVTVTLPSAPYPNQRVVVKDVSGAASTNNITIDGNGKNIDGNVSILMLDDYESNDLQFSAALNKWILLTV